MYVLYIPFQMEYSPQVFYLQKERFGLSITNGILRSLIKISLFTRLPLMALVMSLMTWLMPMKGGIFDLVGSLRLLKEVERDDCLP